MTSTTPSQTPQPAAASTDMPVIRVAVASKDDQLVNQHFGHAKEFLIYEVQGSVATLLEKRSIEQYCHGKDDTPGDLQAILDTLEDCSAVLVSRIGHGPDDRLRDAGIEPVQVYDVIETAVLDFYAQYCQEIS
ncbi:NifB/NifX family molybdenum-iron cluster-binding protein [Geitlerinema sp. PCC 9228]|jgi:nitrogen fixation protein NifB|uniref:NifB/NifX family molybdenum-iron cluster-binding protein n=1 Tax=Geitlerinema sp. PCC 9228 TaxID=111611 RepID=UPI000AFEDDC0|nr:NifB/NifX family molybdenum-iron cluster-binding protein [Geitlerinema sp. PCC 9228]